MMLEKKAKKRRVPLWRQILRSAAARIHRDAQQPITRPEAQKMGRYLAIRLVPRGRPGRKASAAVAKAIELKEKGTPWRAIYAEAIPSFEEMPWQERSWRSYNLRRAVAAMQRRQKRRMMRPSRSSN